MTTLVEKIIIGQHSYYCDSATIADYFIKMALKEDIELKPYKLMLLVYEAYCWNLVINETRLFEDPIEAWDLSPIVVDLYEQLRLVDDDLSVRHTIKYNINLEFKFENSVVDILLNKVWELYKMKSFKELYDSAVYGDTPWYITRMNYKRFSIIPDHIIYDHHKALLKKDERGKNMTDSFDKPLGFLKKVLDFLF